MLRIGEAARRVGVSASALRLWERQGLIRPSRSPGRYRWYSDADVARLREVRRLRREAHINAAGIRRVLREPAPVAHAERSLDGRLLRRLRTDRGLGLREASARSGLSISFISALERGETGASVATLQRLTAAYGTTMDEILRDPSGGGRAGRLVPAAARSRLQLGDGAVRIEQLANGAAHLEPQLFILAAGASSDGDYSHEGEEFLYLLSGALTVWIGEHEVHHLATPGDALTFPSIVPHRWRNDAGGETQLLWINTPPTF